MNSVGWDVVCPECSEPTKVAEILMVGPFSVPLGADLAGVPAGTLVTVPARQMGWRLECGHGVSGDLHELVIELNAQPEFRAVGWWTRRFLAGGG